jgi:lipopolysaccharide transport system permease protein
VNAKVAERLAENGVLKMSGADAHVDSDQVNGAAEAVAEESKGPIRVAPAPRLRIQASKGWRSVNLEELWSHRELVYFLIWRDIKVRYKQTALGGAWAILQPVLTMGVFALFFGRLAKVPSDGVPYAVFTFTGLVPWTFFANGLTQASTSLVQNSYLLTKVYFPRLAIPISTVMAGVVDFILAFIVLLCLALANGIVPTLNVVFLPAFLLLALITSLGVSIWLAALNVQYRDVRYVVPFLTQFWMFATPVAYPSSLLSEPWRTLYALNPMVGVVEGFRWALLGVKTTPAPIVAVSAAAALAVLVTGTLYFRRMERTFADVV